MQNFKYAGFISYAHADEAVAARLHRALETYPIPKALNLQDTTNNGRDKLSPIFRDITELTAHHSLSEKIREAVQTSRFLIVICSPAAKQSHWVNEEIRLFRSLHGEASILCVLAEGTPELSFPPALLEDGREPLAANIGGGKDNFKLGITQLAASMLGVGLDTLIQRESKRRRRRLQLITASALAFSGIMGVTAFTAVEARNEAQESRNQAEGLVEFMITDLKDKLEPVGRLDILDSVGERAVEYYEAQDINQLSDESLSRQARARLVLGQVALRARRMEDAKREITAALRLTEAVLNRRPKNTAAIFAHAQSVFYLGEFYVTLNYFEKAKEPWGQYDALAQQLYNLDPNNIDWILEAGWAQVNLSILATKQNHYDDSILHLENAISIWEMGVNLFPENITLQNEITGVLGDLSISSEISGSIIRARLYRDKHVRHYSSHPDIDLNYNMKFAHIMAKLERLRLRTIALEPQKLNYNYATIITDLENLVNHDPSNNQWKLILIQGYSDYYFETADTKLKKTITNKIRRLINESSKGFETKTQLEFFYTDLIELMNKYDNGAPLEQDQQIEKLLEWKEYFAHNSHYLNIITYEMMSLYHDLKKYDRSIQQAKILKDNYNQIYKNLTPKNIDRLIEAYDILGECAAAKNLSAYLKSRGYKSIHHSKGC